MKAPIILAIIIVICLVVMPFVLLWVTRTPVEKRYENANRHADQLGLQNVKVVCDESWIECSCTFAHDTDYGRVLDTFKCCRSGCSQ
jgi:hypothetical protein